MCDSFLPNQNPTESPYNMARVEALELLAETAAMYCEQLPAEVQNDLHRIPGFHKEHQCSRVTTELYVNAVQDIKNSPSDVLGIEVEA